jgi:hypothetical protein
MVLRCCAYVLGPFVITDRKSLLAVRALAWSLKPKACVSMGAE